MYLKTIIRESVTIQKFWTIDLLWKKAYTPMRKWHFFLQSLSARSFEVKKSESTKVNFLRRSEKKRSQAKRSIMAWRRENQHGERKERRKNCEISRVSCTAIYPTLLPRSLFSRPPPPLLPIPKRALTFNTEVFQAFTAIPSPVACFFFSRAF